MVEFSVSTIEDNNGPIYQTSMNTDDASSLIRARLFLQYDGEISYVSSSECGLIVENTSQVAYDDWNSSFRPPRMDTNKKFNSEIILPISEDVCTFNMIASDKKYNKVSGESWIEPNNLVLNPVNILLEKLVRTVNISKIYNVGNVVYVTTSTNHSLHTGDAVTINDLPIGNGKTGMGYHILGEGLSRPMGTFFITVTGDNTFVYICDNYKDDVEFSYINRGTVTYWEAVCYSDNVISNGYDREMKAISIRYSHPVPYRVGDYVSIKNTETGISVSNASVVSIQDDTVYVYADIPDEYVDSFSSGLILTTYYTPRVPSKSIPVNYPWNDELDDFVTNATVYDHTSNTYKMAPILDTYISSTDANPHDSDVDLIASGGDDYHIICMKFSVPFISTISGTARIGMYVSKMNYSSCSMVMYQMNSSAWKGTSTYSDIKKYITDIPVSSAVIENPSLNGVYSYIEFDIDGSIVKKWLNNTYQYPPCVAVVISSKGTPWLSVNSSENSVFNPYIAITAGESSAVNPDIFNISVKPVSARPGDEVTILVSDYNGAFNEDIYKNTVYFENDDVAVKGLIKEGNASYLKVIVPNMGGGQVNVYVKNNYDVRITENARFSVNAPIDAMDYILADKIMPGIRQDRNVSRSAWYSRDIGFSDFSEITDETSLIQNIYSILLTNTGERLFNYEFGSDIESRLFKLYDDGHSDEILKECIAVCEKYEPRVTIVPEESVCEFNSEAHTLNIDLCLLLPSARKNHIYLTFKKRGRK